MSDYSQIPQRLHVYPASGRAKEIVLKPMTMDTLFFGVVPIQWTTPEAPEFHDVMDKVKAAGFKTIGACPSADAADTSLRGTLKSLQLYLKKINERPDKYRIVRTVKDIDAAENKLGIYFTHQGSGLFEGDVEKVGVFRQLGYGFHTG